MNFRSCINGPIVLDELENAVGDEDMDALFVHGRSYY